MPTGTIATTIPTARGGKKGMAISFVTNPEIAKLKAIERDLGIRINQIR